MRSRSNAIDGTFANGNQRGRHHDGHTARPLLGQDTYDIAFYVSGWIRIKISMIFHFFYHKLQNTFKQILLETNCPMRMAVKHIHGV